MSRRGAMRSDEFGHRPQHRRDVAEEIASALPDLTALAPIPAVAPRARGDRQTTGVAALAASAMHA